MTIARITYWIVALLASTWYGWKAVEIFSKPLNKENRPPSSWYWHQRWLNFLGSFVGWLALWPLTQKYATCFLANCSLEPNYWDFFLALIAFVGMTGYLPFAVLGLISGLKGLGAKAAEFIAPKSPK